MAGINKVILIGNLGRDPEIRTLESGIKVATFSLATTESYRDNNNQWQDQTEWHNIVLWRHNAEKAENGLKKGMQVFIEGKLRTRQWTDQNQNTRYTTEIIGEKMMILTRREGDGGRTNSAPFPSEQDIVTGSTQVMPDPVLPPKIEDDLPF